MKAYDIIDNKKLLTVNFYQTKYLYAVLVNEHSNHYNELLNDSIVFLISNKYDFINLKNIRDWDPSLNIYLDNLETLISKLEELVDNGHYYTIYKGEAIEVFEKIDTNSNKILTPREIKDALDKNIEVNGIKIQELFDLPTGQFQGPNVLEYQEKFGSLISRMDKDFNYRISIGEFLEIYPTLKRDMEDRKIMNQDYVGEDVDAKINKPGSGLPPTARRKYTTGGGTRRNREEYETELQIETVNVKILIKKINSIIIKITGNLSLNKVLNFIHSNFKSDTYENNYKKFEKISDIDEKIKSITSSPDEFYNFYDKEINVKHLLPIEDGCAIVEENNG